MAAMALLGNPYLGYQGKTGMHSHAGRKNAAIDLLSHLTRQKSLSDNGFDCRGENVASSVVDLEIIYSSNRLPFK